MSSEDEAIHFLRSAQLRTGKPCFVRGVPRDSFTKWKIFTSEEDFRSYVTTGEHAR